MRGGFRSTEGPGKPLEEVDDDNESSELKTLPDYLSSFVSTSTIVLLPARNIRPQHVTQLTMIYLPDPPPPTGCFAWDKETGVRSKGAVQGFATAPRSISSMCAMQLP